MSRTNEAMLLPSDRGIERLNRRTSRADIPARHMIETLEEHRQASCGDETGAATRDSGEPKVEQVESLSFAARARAIMLLSLLGWLILTAVLAWLLT